MAALLGEFFANDRCWSPNRIVVQRSRLENYAPRSLIDAVRFDCVPTIHSDEVNQRWATEELLSGRRGFGVVGFDVRQFSHHPWFGGKHQACHLSKLKPAGLQKFQQAFLTEDSAQV